MKRLSRCGASGCTCIEPWTDRSYCQKLWMEASGGDLILPNSVDEFHIFNDLTQPAVAL